MKKIILLIILIILIAVLIFSLVYFATGSTNDYEKGRGGLIQGTFIGRGEYGILVETDDGKTYCLGPAPGIDTGELQPGDRLEIECVKARFSAHREGPNHYIVSMWVLK